MPQLPLPFWSELMTKTDEDVISKERIVELKAMAVGLAGTIQGLTEDTYEAVTLLVMIHLTLWITHRRPDADTKGMLDDYSANFLENFEQNEAIEKGQVQ